MLFSDSDIAAIWLTLRLATTVAVLLLLIGTPLAWWLARTQSRLKGPVSAVVALPLVLPPTVLGFYVLIAFSPEGIIGRFTQAAGLGSLAFTFWGLVLASILYSMPFVVQPIQNAFEAVNQSVLDAAATLRSGPFDRFFNVALPLARPGILTASVLGFAHTVGEFGVVLMVGGNIPGETRVLSIEVYNHVEALEYTQAHALSAGLIGFSFVVLLCLYGVQRKHRSVGMKYGR